MWSLPILPAGPKVLRLTGNVQIPEITHYFTIRMDGKRFVQMDGSLADAAQDYALTGLVAAAEYASEQQIGEAEPGAGGYHTEIQPAIIRQCIRCKRKASAFIGQVVA